MTSQAPQFPLVLFSAILNDPDTSMQYLGLKNVNGESLYHVKTWDSFASNPDLQPLSSFSTRDIWIDATSNLPQRISYIRRAAQGAVPGIAVDITFDNYQNESGVLYPREIQESVNGTAWATITIQSISLDRGLTDSDFPIGQ